MAHGSELDAAASRMRMAALVKSAPQHGAAHHTAQSACTALPAHVGHLTHRCPLGATCHVHQVRNLVAKVVQHAYAGEECMGISVGVSMRHML